MGDKRLLVVPAELIKKIDDNRGDTSQAEFIDILIDNQFQQNGKKEQTQNFVTKEEFQAFEQDIKKLLRSFLDFYVGYGLELGKQSSKSEFEELTSKLKELEENIDSDSDKKATIKWK